MTDCRLDPRIRPGHYLHEKNQKSVFFQYGWNRQVPLVHLNPKIPFPGNKKFPKSTHLHHLAFRIYGTISGLHQMRSDFVQCTLLTKHFFFFAFLESPSSIMKKCHSKNSAFTPNWNYGTKQVFKIPKIQQFWPILSRF